MLTALAVASQTVAVVGPTLGGLLIGVGGWRIVFLVNVPLSLACLALGVLRLPKSPGAGRERRRVDLVGMALFAALLVSLMLFLMKPRADRWYLLVLVTAAATAFALRELRVQEPFIDLRVLGGNVPMLATFLRQLLSYTTAYAFLCGFTQWLEEGRGLHAATAGLVLMPLSLSAMAASAANAAFFTHGADTGGLHDLALFMLAGAVLLLAVTLLDRSLRNLNP